MTLLLSVFVLTSIFLELILVLKSFNGVSRLSKGYLKFKGSFKFFFKEVFRVFTKNFKCVFKKFKGCFKEVSRVF